MNLLAIYSSDLDRLCSQVCLTLLHSLWEFGLLAVGVAIFARLCAARNPERSYVVHVSALLVGLLAIPVTFSLVEQSPRALWVEVEPATADGPAVLTRLEDLPPDFSPAPVDASLAVAPTHAEVLPPVTPPRGFPWLQLARWLSTAYALGVALMLARLCWNIWRCQRLTASCRRVTSGPLAELLQNLSHQWKLRVVPRLALAERIVVPQVVGLLRPTILLPASALTGLTPAELEMILAHELAHVRRWDLWVNLVQRLAEALLFFNPGLWYLSRRISTLREYCCDEQTCRVGRHDQTETRLRYAQALLRVVELSQKQRDTTGLAALAASGRTPSELRCRVARLFGEPLSEPVRLSRSGLGIVVGALALLFLGPLVWSSAGEDPASKDEQEQTQEDSTSFPYGGKVDVVAIGTHGEEPQRWWDAEGNTLKSVPFEWTPERNVDTGAKEWRRVVLRVNAPVSDGDHTDVTWRILGSTNATGGKLEFTAEFEPGKYLSRFFSLDENANSFGIRVGIANGEWKTVAKSEPSYVGSVKGLAGGKSVLFSDAFLSDQGTVTVVSHNYFDQAFRVLAFDKQGQMHRSVFGGGNSAGGIYQSRPTFPRITPEEIDHFEFQTREYEWVEIKDLPVHSEGVSMTAGLDDALSILSPLAQSENSGLQIVSAQDLQTMPENLRLFSPLESATSFAINDKPSFWRAVRERFDHEAGYAGAFDDVQEGFLRDPYGPRVDLKRAFEDQLGEFFTIYNSPVGGAESRKQILAWSVRRPAEVAKLLKRIAAADKETRKTSIDGVDVYICPTDRSASRLDDLDLFVNGVSSLAAHTSNTDGSAFCLIDDLLLIADSPFAMRVALKVLRPIRPEESFSLAPVTTELQRRLLHNDQAVAYLNINGEVLRPQEGTRLDLTGEVTDLITTKLNAYPAEKKEGLLFVHVDFGPPGVDGWHEQLEQWATDLAKRAGFQDCHVTCTFHNADDYAWQRFEPDETERNVTEDAVHADDFRIYAVRTALSRYLAGDVDCFIENLELMSARRNDIFSALEEVVVRQQLERMDFESRKLARINVRLEPPAQRPDGLIERQQENSPFHRLAVEVLRDAGFAEVIVGVEVNSVIATSRYDLAEAIDFSQPEKPQELSSTGGENPLNNTNIQEPANSATGDLSRARIESLKELVNTYEEYYKKVIALRAVGTQGGEADKSALALYRLQVARAELAAAERNFEDVIQHRQAAVEAAKEMVSVMQVLYDAGKVHLNDALNASAELAKAKLALAEAKASKATQSIETSQAKPQAWIPKLLDLNDHNPTAFSIGPAMIAELSPDAAWEVVKQVWPKIKFDEVKTGLLKTFEFARHPRVLDVLDLGTTDESEFVRDYAYTYLQNYALRDFKQEEHDYAAWRRKYAGKPTGEVLKANCLWFVAQLRAGAPTIAQYQLIRTSAMLNLGGTKSGYPQKGEYLREAGLVEVLNQWRSNPDIQPDVKRLIDNLLADLDQSLSETGDHQNADLSGRNLQGLELRKSVDRLFSGANLTKCNLTGATIIGGSKAFYNADFSEADLTEATLIGDAAGQRAKFRSAILVESDFKGGGSGFQSSDFSHADLTNARLSGGGAAFQEASFVGANLTGADLRGASASFQAADFTRATLTGATIRCTDLTGFQGAILTDAELTGADLSSLDPRALQSTEFEEDRPPRYNSATKFPQGFDPKKAGWKLLRETAQEQSATPEHQHNKSTAQHSQELTSEDKGATKVDALRELVANFQTMYEARKTRHELGEQSTLDVASALYQLSMARAELATEEGDAAAAVQHCQQAVKSASEVVEFRQIQFNSGNASLEQLTESRAELAKAKLALAEARKRTSSSQKKQTDHKPEADSSEKTEHRSEQAGESEGR